MIDLFLTLLLITISIVYFVGELWIHKKAGMLFPRYLQKQWLAQQEGTEYELNDNERQVLVKLGRQMVIVTLSILWFFLLLVTISKHITLNYGIVGLIILFFIIFYHYHASFKD